MKLIALSLYLFLFFSLGQGLSYAWAEASPPNAAQPSQRDRGAYLAKMGDCFSCHTSAHYPDFAGGFPLKTPFGTLETPNITPDNDTGIGRWTKAEFAQALRQGRSPKGEHYFPAFPYPYFSTMSDEDIDALYAYFMSLPPVHQVNKPLHFPFNLPGARVLLGGWKVLFLPQKQHTPPEGPPPSSTWMRGRYIVDGLGYCGLCHTPLNKLGSPKERAYLTGAFVEGYWAPNITQANLASKSLQAITHVFQFDKRLHAPGKIAGPMAVVNHNSLRYLTKEDQLAIATYLKSVPSQMPSAPIDQPSKASRGQAVYARSCAMCHDAGATGSPRLGDQAAWTRRLSQQNLTQLYRHTIEGYRGMPAKGGCAACSDADLTAAVDYLLKQTLPPSQWKTRLKPQAK